MKREFVLIICCLMALIAFRSCSHETYNNSERNSNFTVSEARTYFENNATDLSYNEFVCCYAPTKADNNIVPLWNKAKYGTTPNSEVVMIPILEAGRLNAMLTTTLFGQKGYSADNVKVESHLVIQRYDTSKRMRRFITTAIGISHDAKANPYLFTGDRTMFQGFMLISDETGKCEEVFYYTGGERFEMHIADYTTEEKMNNRHLQMSVGFSVMEAMITTKGENVRAYEKGDKYYCYKCHSFANFEDGVCSKCGSSPLEIGGGEAYFFCKGCGKLVRSCICNPKELRPRTSEPDLFEERCDWCGSRHCNGECRRTRKGKGGGDKPQLPTPEQLRDLCTVTIAKPVGGTVMGAGIYKRGSTAIISASPASGYVFAGWNEFLETPVQGLQTVEGWFGSFVRFNNKYQLGLNIYLYKTDDNGRVPSKRIYNVLDIIDFVNRINVCN